LKKDSPRHRSLNAKEKEIVEKSDFIFCVSEKMKRFIASKYNVNESKFIVTPTCVETALFSYSENKKNEARERLSLNGKNVVLFMGHINSWQINDSFVILFRNLKKQMDNIHFLILTDGVGSFQKIFKKCGINDENYSIYSVKHSEVPDYAVSADMAILLRDSSIVNQVAAPAKFGEYLALGLPVIVTKGIGDTEDIIKKHNVGVVLEDLASDEVERRINEMLDLIRHGRPNLSEDCVRVANNLLSKEVSINEFMRVYEECQVGKL
jgi:glycosyltransferase involved in cell wall biosynthesis